MSLIWTPIREQLEAPGLLMRQPRTTQPQGTYTFDWSNPITHDLVDGINHHGMRILNPSFVFLPNSTVAKVKTSKGLAVKGPSTNAPILGAWPSSTSDVTLLGVAVSYSNLVVKSCGGKVGQTASGTSIAFHDTDGVTPDLIRGVMYLGSIRYIGGSYQVASGDPYVAVLRQKYGSYQDLWVNGQQDPIVGNYTGSPISYGYYGCNGTDTNRALLLSLFWKRFLSDQEVRAISANPWSLFL